MVYVEIIGVVIFLTAIVSFVTLVAFGVAYGMLMGIRWLLTKYFL